MKLTITHLYPRHMNLYGDWGNVLCLKKRAEWRGIEVNIVSYNPGDTFRSGDIIVGGGGQDSGQNKIQADLLKLAPELHRAAEQGTPMLMVCGLYQLFGRFFKTSTGEVIKGIGLFGAETHATDTRLIGNIRLQTEFGEIIGYENHSGQTYLDADQAPLGSVITGAGGNSADKTTEGARKFNVIGTYLHGSLLPKNPALADFLIQKALQNTGQPYELTALNDVIADKARSIARQRPV